MNSSENCFFALPPCHLFISHLSQIKKTSIFRKKKCVTDVPTDRRADGRTDGWTDRRMDGRTDQWMDGRTFRPHNGQNALSEPHKIKTLVMSHSLIRSPVRSHRSLTRSLGTACFARAPLRSFARSLAHSLAPELVGQWNIFVQNSVCPESQWNDNEIDAWSTGPFTRPLAHSQNSEFDQ